LTGLNQEIIISPGDFSKDEIREQVTGILEDGGHVMQTIAQQLREEGIKIGKSEGIKIGEEKGIKIGEEKGKGDKAKETAKRMLEDGLPIEAISKYTGLTREEIERLREILQ
jgi:predicted transposase YdaD